MVIGGHRPLVADKSKIVETFDSLSLDGDEDRSSADSDTDTSEDVDSNRQPPCHTNTALAQPGTSGSVQKDDEAVTQDSDSRPFSKAVKWNSSDQYRRGFFKDCVVDVSSTVPTAAQNNAKSQQSAGQELSSGCGSDNAGTVRQTCNSRELHKKDTSEQTVLERVKACLYEWKTAQLVVFLRTNASEIVSAGVNVVIKENVSDIEEVNREGKENNRDKRDETATLYEQKVGEFYGQKPRVRFADTCKQVVSFKVHFHCVFKISHK